MKSKLPKFLDRKLPRGAIFSHYIRIDGVLVKVDTTDDMYWAETNKKVPKKDRPK